MKYCTYIYGRTLKIDFREICSPKGGISTKSASLIEQLLNTDVISNGEINRLRYLFVRERHQVLFGVGINHRQFLDTDHWTDLTGKRGLRSFVGIVVDNDEFDRLTAIPIDPDFFIDLYMKYIPQVWALEDRPKNREIIISEPLEIEQTANWCKLDGNVNFNTGENRCRFFSPSEEDAVIHSLKKCQTSVMVGLNVESHVISTFRKYNVLIPNAICLNTPTSHDSVLVTADQESYRPSQKQRKTGELPKRRTNVSHNDSKSVTVTDSNAQARTHRPAILSDLKECGSTENGTRDNNLSQKDDLMSIDWGETTTAQSSTITSGVVTDSTNSKELIEEDHGAVIRGATELSPIELGGKRENTDDEPKKDFRLMMIIAIIAFVILLMTLALSKMRSKSSRPSPSGVKEVKKEEKMGREKNSSLSTTIEYVTGQAKKQI